MTTKAQLHCLIDELPEAELEGVLQYVTVLHAFLTAPVDDEPLTEEEAAAIEEGLANLAAGRVHPWAEVKARLADLP